MLGKSYGGIAVSFIGLLDLLGCLLAVGEIGMAVHVYFVKLAALRQKILSHCQKPPLGIFYIIAIGDRVVNAACGAVFVQSVGIFVEYCGAAALAGKEVL